MNKKLRIASFLFLFGCNNMLAQKIVFPDASVLAQTKCVTVSINPYGYPATPHTTSILVSDQRYDTTVMVGYFYRGYRDRLSKICAEKSITQTVSSFLNHHFAGIFSRRKDTVLMQLKKLWIEGEEGFICSDMWTEAPYTLTIKMEFYLKKESCLYPLYRFDSVYRFKGNPEITADPLISQAIIASCSKLTNAVFAGNTNRKCLSWLQVDSFNKAGADIAILKDPAPQKGVYLNFNDFRNNRPAFTDFKISMDEWADIVTVKGKTLTDSTLIDAWEFSDGEKIFIRRNKNFFPLFQVAGNFAYYGFNKITLRRPLKYTPQLVTRGNVIDFISDRMNEWASSITFKSKDTRLFHLNMETGSLY